MNTFAFSRRWSALATAAGRELAFGLASVNREVHGWRVLAERIPDPAIRHDAVTSLADKRYYLDGAALFWILPGRRNRELLALLVALQAIANYVDYASERAAAARGSSGGSLVAALIDAVDVGGPFHDYYVDHPQRDDGGFLHALVSRCRRACATLPHYEQARPVLQREARRIEALELSHDPWPTRRDAALRDIAEREFRDGIDASWQERAGSMTSLLGVIALLAVAAGDQATTDELQAVAAAYVPWVGALSIVLDSFIDQHDDALTGGWSFLTYFDDAEAVERRGVELVMRCRSEISMLRDADRHLVILSAMLAMFLTSDNARGKSLAPTSRALLRAGGPMAVGLAPVLRLWRLAYRLRD